MGTPYMGEIKMISWNFAPRGWAFCNGQLLPINQNQALFSILGTTYGGNGQVNFALPDLRGRVPVHVGNGIAQGQRGGEEFHTLLPSEMPGHTHFPMGSTGTPNATTPGGNAFATQLSDGYSTTPNATMHAATVATVGGSQPHDNMSPYTVLNFIIALQGVFPSRN